MFLYVVALPMNTDTDTLMGAALLGHHVFQSLDCARQVCAGDRGTGSHGRGTRNDVEPE